MNKIKLNESKLSKLKSLMHQFNIYPVFIPNYLDKQHPIKDILISLVDEAYNLICLLDENELEILIDNFGWFYKEGVKEKRLGTREYTIAVYVVLYHVLYSKISFNSIIYNNESEVINKFPELSDKIDKDGLLIIDDTFILTPFGIAYNNYLIYYHQFLRKEYGGSFIPEFTNSIIKLIPTGVKSRIAIDHSRIIPLEYVNNLIELDYWHGPLFDKLKIDDPEYVGLTVIGRTVQPLMDIRYTLIRTEFLWKMKESNIKQIEIEEISHVDNKYDEFYFNRYIHAERDVSKKFFQHFDGSIIIYNEDGLSKRIKSNINNAAGSIEKVKLFRLDGQITSEDWVYLTATFFRNNEMIFEYFDPNGFKKHYSSHPQSYLEWIETKNKD